MCLRLDGASMDGFDFLFGGVILDGGDLEGALETFARTLSSGLAREAVG